MQFSPINWLAIAAAIVASFIIGSLWYSPLLFVDSWLRMSGVDKQTFDQGLRTALVGDFFSAAAIALVLNQIIRWSGTTGVVPALIVGFIVWAGFVVSVMLTDVTYEHRPFAFLVITAGYRLVTLEVMAVILSSWR